jgi:hypothetical protein
MNPLKKLRLRRYTRDMNAEEKQAVIENAEAGLPWDFRLPYPYPRNEHEDGMNMVAVMAAYGCPVMSGRSDW